MVRGVRGSAFNQGSGEVYVNPNPSNNRRGGSRKKPVSEYYGPGGNPDGSGENQARQTSQTTVQNKEDGLPGDGGGEQPPSPIKFKKQISASNRNNKFGQLRYPYAILEEETDYLQIEILKYKTLGITPQASVLTDGVRSSKKFYKNVQEELAELFYQVNILGANTSFSGVLARSTGQILNPNTELLFNGVKLRSFNFSFNLAPRNGTEAEQIKKIIIELKRNMAPTSTITAESQNGNAGLFLKSPNVFRLKYKTGNNDHQFLNSFVVAALTNVQVNYTGSGTYMTYNDKSKTPVHMVMQLSFQELSPIYAEDYDDFGNEGANGIVGGVGF